VRVLLDAAHSAGQVPLALDALGADFTTGNLHKWTCAPKGAAFLHARVDHQRVVRPPVTSHGANSPRTDRSRFQLEFDWVGTSDPTAWLSVPKALELLPRLFGSWEAIRAENHALAVRARARLSEVVGTTPPAPEALLGSMAAVLLPPLKAPLAPGAPDPLQERLFHEHAVEVPVYGFQGSRVLRVSAQRYNTFGDYEKLAGILPGLL
jgi:isopenicillin-N epimerase